MIKLTRSDPALNMNRFYTLQVQPTLFGEYLLVAEWGRIGYAGHVQETPYPSKELAQAALAKRQTVKLRRGYRAY